MANKQTVQDVDAALDRWHAKLNMCVRKINELRDKRKKMLAGKIKVPAPKPSKVLFTAAVAPFDDSIADLAQRPIAPGTMGPC